MKNLVFILFFIFLGSCCEKKRGDNFLHDVEFVILTAGPDFVASGSIDNSECKRAIRLALEKSESIGINSGNNSYVVQVVPREGSVHLNFLPKSIKDHVEGLGVADWGNSYILVSDFNSEYWKVEVDMVNQTVVRY